MTTLARRDFFKKAALLSTGLASVGLIAGCTSNTVNGVTTITLDTAEVTSYANAGLGILQTVLAFTGLPSNITSVATLAINVVKSALADWSKFTNGKTSITFNKTSVPAALTSLLAALNQAATQLSQVATAEASSIGASLATRISSVSSDVGSVASIISGMVSMLATARMSDVTSQASRYYAVSTCASRHGVSVTPFR